MTKVALVTLALVILSFNIGRNVGWRERSRALGGNELG